MKSAALFASLTLCLLWSGAPAFAEEEKCPVAHGGEDFIDKVAKAIEAAPSCSRAAALATACALGASGDNAIVAPAVAKCEAQFKGKLKRKKRKLYAKRRKACERKYARKSGTMYISMAAFCRLKLAEKFAARHEAKE